MAAFGQAVQRLHCQNLGANERPKHPVTGSHCRVEDYPDIWQVSSRLRTPSLTRRNQGYAHDEGQQHPDQAN